MELSNIPALQAFVDNLEEVGISAGLRCKTDKGWTIQLNPGIVLTYQDRVISVRYGQEEHPFWQCKSPDDKAMLRGTIEVVRKLRRMGYEPGWAMGSDELFLKMHEKL